MTDVVKIEPKRIEIDRAAYNELISLGLNQEQAVKQLQNTPERDINFALALAHAERGWKVFPCHQDKKPITKNGYKDATTDAGIISAWWTRNPGALIGIPCTLNDIFAVDIDTKNGVDGLASWRELVETKGGGQAFYVGPIQATPSNGQHLIFKIPAGLNIPNNAGKLGPGLDLRSNGYICTGALINGTRYTWLVDHGPGSTLTEAPKWLLDCIEALTAPKQTAPQPVAQQTLQFAKTGEKWLQEALSKVNSGDPRNDTGFWMAGQLRDDGLTEAEARGVMLAYAGRVPQPSSKAPYTATEALKSLASAYNQAQRPPAKGAGGGSSFSSNGHHPTIEDEDSELVLLTDIGNFTRFARAHKDKVLYVAQWGWLVWNGKYWEKDEGGKVVELAKETVKQLYIDAQTMFDDMKKILKQAQQAAESGDEKKANELQERGLKIQSKANNTHKWAITSQGSARLAAIVGPVGAQTHKHIRALHSDFDASPWHINCQNGLLDLQTGILTPHSPSMRVAKIAGAAYNPAATCPTWLSFLDRIFEGDREVINFIQRAAGYTLTGINREQCFFFLYGTGKNGKSTFAEALQAVLGDYAKKTPTQTLMHKKFENSGPSPDLARLDGARMVSANEVSNGHKLNEALIKDLTGGDRISARFLHKELFEFTPVFKLWMYGNHKPKIEEFDDGIKRRVKLIPFSVSIPERERDVTLGEKLRAELDGILAWILDGCLAWQLQGLDFPQKILEATDQYLAEQDLIGAFLDDCCLIQPMATVKAGDLFTAYEAWAADYGIDKPLNSTQFGKELPKRGFKKDKIQGYMIYSGLGLLEKDPQS